MRLKAYAELHGEKIVGKPKRRGKSLTLTLPVEVFAELEAAKLFFQRSAQDLVRQSVKNEMERLRQEFCEGKPFPLRIMNDSERLEPNTELM
ncbi:hypothetical protein AYO40_01035 [Planctomycetaceae bacterium SCGC AG-212-D15]|nr:hypothetical protein AYO40_01035 [Planctomycetaceae bacterium SCGC AG-212-D15]